MKNLKQAQKVLDLMRTNGEVTPGLHLVAANLSPARLPVYVHEIRTRLGVSINSVKQGRKTVAYRLAATAETINDPVVG